MNEVTSQGGFLGTLFRLRTAVISTFRRVGGENPPTTYFCFRAIGVAGAVFFAVSVSATSDGRAEGYSTPPAVRAGAASPVKGAPRWGGRFVAHGYVENDLRSPGAFEPPEEGNTLSEGVFGQTFGAKLGTTGPTVEAFYKFDYKKDRNRIDANNKTRHTIGGKIGIAPFDDSVLEVGGQYERERRRLSGDRFSGFTYFLNWWSGWYWKGAEAGKEPLGYSLSTWGQARVPSSHIAEADGNYLAEGEILGDIDIARINSLGLFAVRAALYYSFDTAPLDWNNKLEPFVGVLFKLPVTGGVHIEVGGGYGEELFLVSDRRFNGYVAFLKLRANWSLLD